MKMKENYFFLNGETKQKNLNRLIDRWSVGNSVCKSQNNDCSALKMETKLQTKSICHPSTSESVSSIFSFVRNLFFPSLFFLLLFAVCATLPQKQHTNMTFARCKVGQKKKKKIHKERRQHR